MAIDLLDLRPNVPTHRRIAGRDDVVNETMPMICSEWFPDNSDNRWHVENTAHQGDRSYALVRPEPDDVGYDRFVVLVEFGADGALAAAPAVYCREAESTYNLLASSQDCPNDIPIQILW